MSSVPSTHKLAIPITSATPPGQPSPSSSPPVPFPAALTPTKPSLAHSDLLSASDQGEDRFELQEDYSGIHDAAFSGNLHKLVCILKGGENVNRADKYHTTPLHYATYNNQPQCIEILLSYGAEVDARDMDGSTALALAAYKGFEDCVQKLLQGNANVHIPDNEGVTCLHKAAFGGHVACIRLLIKKGLEVNIPDQMEDTPLHHASFNGNLAAVKCLVELGADINALDDIQGTPLHKAVFAGHQECVAELLACGADPNLADADRIAPLHIAVLHSNTPICELLLRHNADPSMMDSGGAAPLHTAAFNGSDEICSLLLSASANVNIVQTGTGETPIHFAAWRGNSSCISLFVKHNGRLDAADNEGATPLHKAAYNGHLECMRTLLEEGASVQSTDLEGSTPLHKAAYMGRTECVQLLLEHGAEVNTEDNGKGTALHNAVFNGHADCVAALLAAGAHANVKDEKGGTPLHTAARKGYKDCVSMLLEKGADHSIPNSKGLLATHVAVGHAECLKLLLDHGAAVDPLDGADHTPLYYATRNGKKDSMKLLIMSGADINKKDKKGKRPLDAQSKLTKAEILKVIEESDREKEADRMRHYKAAAAKFNNKVQSGFDFLLSASWVNPGEESKEIARFFVDCPHLNKTLVGDYLGSLTDSGLAVLDAFVDSFDFEGLDFDVALRRFLSKFRLPGEAQKIDRIMERWACRYHQNNPTVFSNEDTAYILAFSVIMLNTDAHNPSIKNKMTKEAFVNNNKGIDCGNDLPRVLLEDLYDKIVKEEIKMEASATTWHTNAELKGWLTKQGGRIKTWKKRWFVLQDNVLYYFKNSGDTEPCGIIPLENLAVRATNTSKKHSFELFSQAGEDANTKESQIKSCKVTSSGAIVKGHHDSYVIAAENKQMMEEWIEAIRSNTCSNPVFELMRRRKQKKAVPAPVPQRKVSLLHKDTRIPFKVSSSTKGKDAAKETAHAAAVAAGKIAPKPASSHARDFSTLCSNANMCSMAMRGKEAFASSFGPSWKIVEGDGGKFLICVNINASEGTQHIVVRRMGWEDAKSLAELAAGWKKASGGDLYAYLNLGPLTESMRDLVMPQLQLQYGTVLVGHGVAGIHAVWLADLLRDKSYRISQVITFSLPKFADRQKTEKFQGLPILRVSDHHDIFPALFPGYWHVGEEVLLLALHHFCVLHLPENREFDATSINAKKLEGRFGKSNIDYYIQRLLPKLNDCNQVPPINRSKYA